jgi:VanZ family protein
LIRKFAHLTEYFILGLLLFRFFRNDSNDLKMLRWMISAMIVLALYAAGDEFHQSFVPTRTASIVDIGIDISGGLLAQLVSGFGLLYWQR